MCSPMAPRPTDLEDVAKLHIAAGITGHKAEQRIVRVHRAHGDAPQCVCHGQLVALGIHHLDALETQKEGDKPGAAHVLLG